MLLVKIFNKIFEKNETRLVSYIIDTNYLEELFKIFLANLPKSNLISSQAEETLRNIQRQNNKRLVARLSEFCTSACTRERAMTKKLLHGIIELNE